jgi:hypothetical protein
MVKIKFLPFALAICLLAACSPSPQAIQTAIAQTQAAWTPTFTLSPSPSPSLIPSPTTIPFSQLNLEDKLVVAGDLPPGYSGSQIRYTPNTITNEAPVADYFINQYFAYQDTTGGKVTVLVYEEIDKVIIAYQSFFGGLFMGIPEDAGVGEKSASFYNEGNITVSNLAFIRCHAAIQIQFIGPSTRDSIIAYGQRLDKRLQPIVCRP